MKISDSIRLTQKRNFIILVSELSLKINELDFVDDVIYDQDSYTVSTKMCQVIPSKYLVKLSSENKAKIFAESFIHDVFEDESFYVTLSNISHLDGVCTPDTPIIKVKGKNLMKTYNVFLKNKMIHRMLIVSDDYQKGLFIKGYADCTIINGIINDGPAYECYRL